MVKEAESRVTLVGNYFTTSGIANVSTSTKNEALHLTACCVCGVQREENAGDKCGSCGTSFAMSESLYLMIREEVIDNLFVDADQVTPTSRLQDLGEDSLGMLQMFMELEERLDVSFGADAQQMETISDLVRYALAKD